MRDIEYDLKFTTSDNICFLVFSPNLWVYVLLGLKFIFSPQITVTDHGVPAKSTTVRVIVRVLDENDNRPLFLEKIYKIKLPERERPEKERAAKRDPVYRVIASDRDEGPNAEISYSIEEGDENGKFFIEPKTGMVSSKKFSSAGEYDILTVSIKTQGSSCPQPDSLSVSSTFLQQMLVYCFSVVFSCLFWTVGCKNCWWYLTLGLNKFSPRVYVPTHPKMSFTAARRHCSPQFTVIEVLTIGRITKEYHTKGVLLFRIWGSLAMWTAQGTIVITIKTQPILWICVINQRFYSCMYALCIKLNMVYGVFYLSVI